MISTWRAGLLCVEVDPTTGVLTRLEHEGLGLNLVAEPRLAENWRLQVPLPSRRGHFILGTQQALRAVTWDGTEAVLRWSDLTSPDGQFDIEVLLRLRFRTDELECDVTVHNHSPYVVEAVYAPCLGGVRRTADAADWQLFGARVISGAWSYPFFQEVVSSYHGPPVSNVLHPYPGGWTNPSSLGMPWVALLNDRSRRGVYIGNHNPEITFSTFWAEFNMPLAIRTANQAAFGSFVTQTWPAPEAMADQPYGATLGWVMFPFLPAGDQWHGPPIVVKFLEGTWWQAADRFRAWIDSRQPQRDHSWSWLYQADAWLSLVMLENDGTLRYHARDLARVAAEAASAGVGVLLLVGWSMGGLDGGYPDYRVDPRVGGEAEFAQAVAACQAGGVRVMLMANVAQVHVETPWFKAEGHRYIVRNAFGDYYGAGGVWYGFATLMDQLGSTVPQMMTANPAHPAFQAHMVRSLEAMQALGIDGILLDKVNTGDPYCLDFNPELPGTPASRFHAALERTVRAGVEATQQKSPDFRYAIETGWDRILPYGDAAYTRYFEQDHAPLVEYLFPEVRQTNCVVSDADLALVNNCLRHGHIICFEALYYHGVLSDVPRLTRYVREVLRVRRELRHLLWDGRIIPADFAEVRGQVWTGAFATSQRALREVALVLNHFERTPQPVEIAFRDGPWTQARLFRPFREPEEVGLPVSTSLAPDEFLVIVPYVDTHA